MTPERMQQLAQLAEGIAQNLIVSLPFVEEASYVASRVHALIYGNGVDLAAMQAEGHTTDSIAELGTTQFKLDLAALLRVRNFHEQTTYTKGDLN